MTEPETDPLVIMPIPALSIVLTHLERQKGSPLTREEVLKARDDAVCLTVPLSVKRAMDEKRGYEDIDPGNVWEEWQRFRAQVPGG